MNEIEMKLAKLARNGDREAFAQIVELYKDKMFHLAYRLLGHSHEAEDMVQETFLRVYRNLHRFNEVHKFSTWIYRIGTNVCIDRLRKRKKNISLDAEVNDGEGLIGYTMLASEESTPEQQLILSETKLQIHRCIEKLPEKYKTAIVLRYLHELSLQEISEILQLPVSTVKTRVHRGREYLRQKLDREQLL